MSSARKHLLRRTEDRAPREPWNKPRRRGFPKPGRFKPRVGIQVWLTALFMLVTATAGIAAYEIVRPILTATLEQTSEAYFEQVGDEYDSLRQRSDDNLSVQRIRSFAVTRGLQWGIVDPSDGTKLRGDEGLEWNPEVVQEAVSTGLPAQDTSEVGGDGPRSRQERGTYAVPIRSGGERVAVVFTRYFPESDVRNVEAATSNINRIAFLAGGLALLITGLAGYS